MEEYQLNNFSLAKAINLSNSTVRQIVTGKSKITVLTVLRLARLFGQTSAYWLDLQRDTDLKEAENDAELSGILNGINKAKKPITQSKAKSSADKRKEAVKPQVQDLLKGNKINRICIRSFTR